MKTFKKLFVFLFGTFVFVGLPAMVFADANTTTNWSGVSGRGGEGNLISTSTDTKETGLQGAKLLDTIKKFINWMLGMLATIALVICLYAGFLMVTAAGDDGRYKKGMGILKQAGIGLVIIGLAWMIVSVIFWLISAMMA